MHFLLLQGWEATVGAGRKRKKTQVGFFQMLENGMNNSVSLTAIAWGPVWMTVRHLISGSHFKQVQVVVAAAACLPSLVMDSIVVFPETQVLSVTGFFKLLFLPTPLGNHRQCIATKIRRLDGQQHRLGCPVSVSCTECWQYVLGVPSTYCQPKTSFQQLNFRFVWVVGGSRAGWGTLNIGSDCTASTCCSGLTWPTSHQIMPSKYGFHCVFFSYTHVVSKRGVVETHALLWMRVRGNYSIDLPFF